MKIIKKPIEEIVLLHKQGDHKATACLLKTFDKLITWYSRSQFSDCINEDIKSEMVITVINALNKYDIYKYLDKPNKA